MWNNAVGEQKYESLGKNIIFSYKKRVESSLDMIKASSKILITNVQVIRYNSIMNIIEFRKIT